MSVMSVGYEPAAGPPLTPMAHCFDNGPEFFSGLGRVVLPMPVTAGLARDQPGPLQRLQALGQQGRRRIHLVTS